MDIGKFQTNMQLLFIVKHERIHSLTEYPLKTDVRIHVRIVVLFE